MSDPPRKKDDSWLAHLNCPQYFDFTAALQAPCSVDLQHNPPLHDFVYQSDEESNDFFRNAAPSTPSPIPLHEQPRMLDPRHFGKPVYRHRPKTTFEEFLRQYHVRRRKQRRSAYAVGSGHAAHPQSPDPPTPPSSSTTSSRSRYKSLPSERTNYQPHLPLKLPEAQVEEDINFANDTNTPVKVSSGTPVSSRRTPHRYTPSHIRHPVSIARSLFLTPSSPSSSPLRKARRNPQSLRSNPTISTEQLPSPLTQVSSDDSQKPHREETSKSSGLSATTSLRPPARTTPSAPNGSLGSSSNLALLQRTTSESKPQSNLVEKKSPDFFGLPRRNIRPFGSTTSSSSESPSIPFVTQTSSNSILKSHGNDSESQDRNQNKTPPVPNVSPSLIELGSLRNQSSKSICDHSDDTEGDQLSDNPSTEIDDPDLLRKVKEHNQRLRKSGRHVPNDLFDRIEETSNCPAKQLDGLSEPQTNACTESAMIISMKPAQGKHADISRGTTLQLRSVFPKPIESTVSSKSQRGIERQNEQSLQDLLSSENNRVLQERKQRLPEQRRARKLNKESFLRGMEGRDVATRTRVSAKVVFTPSTNSQERQNGKHIVEKENPVEGVGHSSDNLKMCSENPVSSSRQRRGAGGFKVRSKSAMAKFPNEDQNCNPNLPRDSIDPRSRPPKESVTDRVKAMARQKREEERIERDLKSMLSLHNNKVRSKRSGRT